MKIIDFHTHILPNADHGSDSLETSLKQLELSEKVPIDTFIATSHFYPHRHRVNDFLKRRDESYSLLSSHTNKEIILGAEVLLCEGLNKLPGIENLTIGNSKIILLELPFNQFKSEYENAIEAFIDEGYTVVLAHADRYPKENIERLLPLGVKIQLNASSLSGFFPKKHMTPNELDPYTYLYCACVFGAGDDVSIEEILQIQKDYGVRIWAPASTRDEASIDLAVAYGAELITCNNPDEVLTILRKKGLHK